MKKKLYDENGNVVNGVKVKKPFYKRWWFIALVVVVIIGAIEVGGDDDDVATDTSEPEVEEVVVEETESEEVISVTADEILSAYKENEVNANSVYKGNLVELTGKLSSISESDSGKVSLVVKPDSDELWLEDISVELENSEGIENLSTDSEITVMGTADTGILYTVVLKKASIVQ